MLCVSYCGDVSTVLCCGKVQVLLLRGRDHFKNNVRDQEMDALDSETRMCGSTDVANQLHRSAAPQ